jgi:flagellum-specific peptidoglycan hydrolase FlgJ
MRSDEPGEHRRRSGIGGGVTEPSPQWLALVETYRLLRVPYPELKGITLAQWALESSWGTSRLATEHNNFAGIGYRRSLWWYARPVNYTSSDGEGRYCHFHSRRAFVRGYWRLLGRRRYAGWQSHAADPEAFLFHLKTCGYAADPDYVGKVMRVYRWLKDRSAL